MPFPREQEKEDEGHFSPNQPIYPPPKSLTYLSPRLVVVNGHLGFGVSSETFTRIDEPAYKVEPKSRALSATFPFKLLAVVGTFFLD